MLEYSLYSIVIARGFNPPWANFWNAKDTTPCLLLLSDSVMIHATCYLLLLGGAKGA